jgi:hypothetical protein
MNMRATVTRGRKPTDISRTAADKRFGKYKGETEKAVRTADVNENHALSLLRKIWETHDVKGNHIKMEYDKVHALLQGIGISADDVKQFSVMLMDLMEDKRFPTKAGVFLSAMINLMEEDSVEIDVRHLEGKVNYLGMRNKKNVTIFGDLGSCAFELMESGTVLINGDVRRGLGYWMKNGEIIVEGNVRRECGAMMRGGRITVRGDTSGVIGRSMVGGVLIFEGRLLARVGYMKGGEIRSHIDYPSGTLGEGKVYYREKLLANRGGNDL